MAGLFEGFVLFFVCLFCVFFALKNPVVAPFTRPADCKQKSLAHFVTLERDLFFVLIACAFLKDLVF